MRRSAALAAAAALVGLAPAASAGAALAEPTSVAIVIAGHGVACVPWHAGLTGDELLNDVATVKYRPTDGIITQIDGTPANNRADDTHYWSYWHTSGKGWSYSIAGASAFHPQPGTVEGWHFIDGSPNATPPPTRSYASICPETSTAPSPAPRTSAAPAPRTSSAARASAPVVPATNSSTAPSSRAVERTSRAPAPSTRRSSAVAAPAPASTAAASALPTLHVRAAGDATHHTDGGSVLPTVLVVAIVAVLGAAAVVVTRRRRRT